MVKLTKKQLKRVLGRQQLDALQLQTVLKEIEATINSRPLVSVSSTLEDLSVVTPADFLLAKKATALPDPPPMAQMNPPAPDDSRTLIKRYERVQQLSTRLWQWWSSTYLSTLNERQKWIKDKRPIQVGDLCLLQEDNIPRLAWPLARVVQVYPGPDGIVRSVRIKTKHGEYDRPVVRLALLESTIGDHDRANNDYDQAQIDQDPVPRSDEVVPPRRGDCSEFSRQTRSGRSY